MLNWLVLQLKTQKPMEILTKIAHYTMTTISLMTAFGVFMHDGRVDRAAMTAMHSPFQATYSGSELLYRMKSFVETDAHTHPDHNAARSSLLNSFAYQSPSVPPRNQDQKRLHQQMLARGHHAFDNANLPIIA